MENKIANVFAVSKKSSHEFSKEIQENINLVTMHGIEGDAHAGKYVKHRSRVKKDPSQLNIRQVHLMAYELLEELLVAGHQIKPGELGENITTIGIELTNLPKGTILKIGRDAEVEITGLREPCKQIENFQDGLLKKVISKTKSGKFDVKSGVMSIVIHGGTVSPGDKIEVIYPVHPHIELKFV